MTAKRAKQPPRPATRAQRRVSQREQLRTQRQAQETRPSRGLSSNTLIGVAVTLVVVVAAVLFALNQLHTTSRKVTALNHINTYSPASSLLKVGTQAPDFTLQDALTGKSYTLSTQRGHPVMLELFAVWCPICQGEAPTIARVTSAFVPRGVRVWSVLSSPYGRHYEESGGRDLTPPTKADMAWFAHKFKVTHPQLVDPNFKVVNRYLGSGYPVLYIVDKNGIIRYAHSGPAPYGDLATKLNKALKG